MESNTKMITEGTKEKRSKKIKTDRRDSKEITAKET
jgi:hypothetical protein